MNYYESNNINTSANTIKAFWSWNDKLDKDLLIKQLEDIKKSGMTGFFMHARAGLLTEYMSEEWLYCIKVCLEKAKELGLGAWFYDENGWPSGFANGAVPKKGTDFRQKWLDIEIYSQNKELPNNIIGFYQQKNDTFIKISRPTDGCLIIRFDINRFYIDALNEKAIECFIENTHDIYYNTFKEYFGNTIQGFFTDEPQYGNNGKIPWSQVLPEKFYDTYGYDLIECLPALFYKTKNHTAVRNDFYSLISSVFVNSFIKKMYDWCEAHHCKLTGHMMAEDNIANQIRCTGGVMPCYQYFHEPGIDWLGRIIGNPLTPKQLGSVAAQLKKKTITESFALCGWDVSLNELKWISQWQYVNGVTSICPHLEAYSLRGMRKRDYPAAVFTQVPWFENNFGYFNKYMSNLGALLDSGKDYAPLLVLHPIKSAYLYANPKDSSELTEYSNDFSDCSSGLSENHFLYHYADEEILKNFGSVTGNEIKIGACIYRYVFLPRITNISRSTFSILFMFSLNGGKIISFNEKIQFVEGRTFDELNSLNNKIIQISSFNELREILTDCRFTRIITDNTENKSIYCCEKTMPDKSRIFYTVNLSSEKQHTEIYIKDAVSVRKLNVINGEYEAVAFRADGEDLIVDMTFDAYGSAVFELNNVNKEVLASPITEQNIPLTNTFEITECSDNCLTLDVCRYKINGSEWNPQKAVILIQQELLRQKKPCDIELEFSFFIDGIKSVPEINICMESPELFDISINGKSFNFTKTGYFIDHSIKKSKLVDILSDGKNIITLKGKFYQNENVYKTLFSPNVHESELNKLTYNTELESIYITGSFGVETENSYTLMPRRCIGWLNNFKITKQRKTVDIRNITSQGFWFFSGSMTLAQNINIEKDNNTIYCLQLKNLFCPAAELWVNGQFADTLAFSPYTVNITDFVINGTNRIELKLFSGNRNVFGPHHRTIGESYFVSPATFTDQPDWDISNEEPLWTDDYSFTVFGIEL